MGTAFYSHLYCAGLSLFMFIVWVRYTCMREYAYNLAIFMHTPFCQTVNYAKSRMKLIGENIKP